MKFSEDSLLRGFTFSVCVEMVCWGCTLLLNHSSGGHCVAQQLAFRDLDVDRRLPNNLEKMPGDFSVEKNRRNLTLIFFFKKIFRRFFSNGFSTIIELTWLRGIVGVVILVVGPGFVCYVPHGTTSVQSGCQTTRRRTSSERIAPFKFSGALPGRQNFVVRVTC